MIKDGNKSDLRSRFAFNKLIHKVQSDNCAQASDGSELSN